MQGNGTGIWRQELSDFTRAFSGAFLFGMPLLFTLEMWWIGEYADLWKLLVFLGVALGANLGLAYFMGFRLEHSVAQIFNQAVHAVAVGAVASLLVLVVLNRITLHDSLDSILGKEIFQAVPLSLGAPVANAVFAPRDTKGPGDGPTLDRLTRTGRSLERLDGAALSHDRHYHLELV